ncbi:predicted protein [Plenodomus lingam JN3]|uniref:Predicted protein n=1 Tax=Leptosphaeria maculans (strain JN3 / isolate v23.1.3 / race Av1-4-5-6-7-8) TaxID=985895 RepID=E4ZVS2_LEPMJ|nr:predicted protein [Plenodomus lingam JN3]CBX95698.1 predicted protein [Plenodomus lingam JN3]
MVAYFENAGDRPFSMNAAAKIAHVDTMHPRARSDSPPRREPLNPCLLLFYTGDAERGYTDTKDFLLRYGNILCSANREPHRLVSGLGRCATIKSY